MYSAIQAAADSNCSRDKINPRFFVLKEPGICYLLKWDFKEVMQRFNRCSDSTKISSCVLEKDKEWQFQVFFCAFGGTGKEVSAARLRNLIV